MNKILVIGACGQLGSELTLALRDIHSKNNVVASDVREPEGDLADGPFEILNVMNKSDLENIIDKYSITQIYHLAAILSAKGEKDPKFAWDLNMNSLLNVLELARDKKLEKIYWPSSIAVFGPNTPSKNTPQHTVMDPNTVYGISKLAGERWCEYYFEKYGVDVRSLRYPGLIGYKAKPGGGTTDYAVDIFHKALEDGTYESFLSEDTYLPMMYMDDAIKATINIMEADKEKIKIRSSYNIAAISFSPKEIAGEIMKHLPNFSITYNPDFRQSIANSWPDSIDDSEARSQWGWQHQFDLSKMTSTILTGLKELLNHQAG
ncbi:NAD-dependent epimerase/dehydratase family protein [Fulvivirga kasyanovii]|uniref:NAD-dependent epimerase/dehydratase family protein n=1 Tax=Fulvivirga kasyanovii TaxID=396812 RepID=A0ABW9RK74_9BACT|nr:NAD-dependent epimerase/dehydratase family protein [Fulvivirga kasyanovii]MTI23779.1 NAD-dependent epimerase/dehydratase family protein [Fulvivirga kasyanovii]